MKYENKNIPLWQREILSIEEAAAYSLIGENRLRALIKNNDQLDFVLRVGNRRRIKRKEFEKYVLQLTSI